MLTETRYQYLMWLWENETNDEETQEWRDELDQEEQELVDRWDNGFYEGLYQEFNSAGRICLESNGDYSSPGNSNFSTYRYSSNYQGNEALVSPPGP